MSTDPQITSSGFPSSFVIGAHHEHDKEFNEIGENISSFRNTSSLFSRKANPAKKQNMPDVIDDLEDGMHCLNCVCISIMLKIKPTRIFLQSR